MQNDFPRPPLVASADLRRVRLRAQNAMVSFVSTGEEFPAEVVARMYSYAKVRLEPVDGGRILRVPVHYASPPLGPYVIQKDGWERETCLTCLAEILAGQDCWENIRLRERFVCDRCHEGIVQYESRGSDAPSGNSSPPS